MVMPRKYFTPEDAHEARKAGWRASNLRRKQRRAREREVNRVDRSGRPSVELLAARDAAPERPLIAAYVGDPVPGRSALDASLSPMPTAPKPVRLQLSRAKGFNLQSASRALNGLDAVNCARPGKYGNPFRIGGYFKIGDPHGFTGPLSMSWCESFRGSEAGKFTEIMTAAHAVAFYRQWRAGEPLSAARRAELRGKNLACWCRPGEPCHADVLLELANK